MPIAVLQNLLIPQVDMQLDGMDRIRTPEMRRVRAPMDKFEDMKLQQGVIRVRPKVELSLNMGFTHCHEVILAFRTLGARNRAC